MVVGSNPDSVLTFVYDVTVAIQLTVQSRSFRKQSLHKLHGKVLKLICIVDLITVTVPLVLPKGGEDDEGHQQWVHC